MSSYRQNWEIFDEGVAQGGSGRLSRVRERVPPFRTGLLKVPNPALGAAAVADILHEVRVRNLDFVKPLTVPTFDSSDDPDDPWFVMAIGTPLPAHPFLSRKASLAFIAAITRALDILHRHDYVFCDVKKTNIVLYAGEYRLIDFGTAYTLAELEHLGFILGTPGHQPLELLLFCKYCFAYDFFSLAVSLQLTLLKPKAYKIFAGVIANDLSTDPGFRHRTGALVRKAWNRANRRYKFILRLYRDRWKWVMRFVFASVGIALLTMLAIGITRHGDNQSFVAENLNNPRFAHLAEIRATNICVKLVTSDDPRIEDGLWKSKHTATRKEGMELLVAALGEGVEDARAAKRVEQGYRRGWGLPHDRKKARFWYGKAYEWGELSVTNGLPWIEY